MIRIIKEVYNKQVPVKQNPYYREYAGLRTDTKPTEDVTTGSLFLEVDTGDVYAFDEVGGEWNKIAALGGGI